MKVFINSIHNSQITNIYFMQTTNLTPDQYPSFANQVNELTKPMNLKVIGQLNHGGPRGEKGRTSYPPVFTQDSPYAFNVNGDPTQQKWQLECSYDNKNLYVKLLPKCPLMMAHTLASYESIAAVMPLLAEEELNLELHKVQSEIKYGFGQANDVYVIFNRSYTPDEDLPRIFSRIIELLDEVLEDTGYISGDLTYLMVDRKITSQISARSSSSRLN